MLPGFELAGVDVRRVFAGYAAVRFSHFQFAESGGYPLVVVRCGGDHHVEIVGQVADFGEGPVDGPAADHDELDAVLGEPGGDAA